MTKLTKKVGLAILLLAVMFVVGCADSGETERVSESGQIPNTAKDADGTEGESSGKVYFLNRHPEQQQQLDELAQAFEQETGIPVKVTTVEEDSYDAVLETAMQDSEIPTLFEVNTLEGLEKWSGVCYDLKETALYPKMNKDTGRFASSDGRLLAIGGLEGDYGIIYNKKLLEKYCALDGSMIASADEITNFVVLKAVAEDIQDKKDKLGIEGAFASVSVTDMLARNAALMENETYQENLQRFLELYGNHCVSDPKELGAKTDKDGAVEFALEEAVFYLGGSWSYDTLGGNEVADGDLGMLPVYMGLEGEQNQGLCHLYQSYFCVNKSVLAEDMEASLRFLEWLFVDHAADMEALESMEWSPLVDAVKAWDEKQAVFWQTMRLDDLPRIRELRLVSFTKNASRDSGT